MADFYPKNGRVIFHIDANAFFASVEIAENPTLSDKPLLLQETRKNEKESSWQRTIYVKIGESTRQ